MIAIVMMAHTVSAAPDNSGVAMYRARAGDTLELIAAEYYGDRNDAVFIMVENHIVRPRPLRAGDKLRIPISRDYTTSPGDTFEAIATTYLGDARRGPFLAEFNGLPPDASVAAGTTISIPFHVAHTATASESLAAVASAYFNDPAQGAMLQRYNFLDRNTLDKGDSIVVPIFHVRVRTSKLPPVDADSKARRDRRQASADRAAAALPAARTAWRTGDFAGVKRELAGLDVDYLDAAAATEIGELLGSAYLAYDDADSALATFKRVVERNPHATLAAYAISPKILAVWQRAGGHLESAP